MQRRLFLQLSGVNLVAIPLLPAVGQPFVHLAPWQVWLQKIVEDCAIETLQPLFYTDNLPTDWSESAPTDFAKATRKYYFYQQRQYCFTVFEKYHAVAGLLELAVPFWKRQSDGSWQQIACLSLFELEALARASDALSSKTKESPVSAYLLPISRTLPGTYITAQGYVQMLSIVESAGVRTAVCITDKNGTVWQQDLKSTHCLTCQV